MLASLLCASVQALPAKPTPHWSWDTLPIAFHGANRSGLYTPDAEAQLARYSMVTLEKWYTPCGAQGPTQAGPECDVEDKMFGTFRRIKALKPNITTIMYLNSNFDFAFYSLHGRMMAREAAGEPSYLRDMNGKVVELCNDGNVYCGITTFDHANPAVNALWTEALLNATKIGGVDGVFADHGNANPKPVPSGGEYSQMCNGKGAGRRCFNFTNEFAQRFTAGHEALLNHSQDTLAKSTGGPVICGPYANWHEPTDFEALREVVARGEAGTGPFVIEASKGACTLPADEAKLAGYLCAMGKFTYLACFNSQSADEPLPKYYDAYTKPLGESLHPSPSLFAPLLSSPVQLQASRPARRWSMGAATGRASSAAPRATRSRDTTR